MVRGVVRLFIGQLPAWARRDHPVLRHELGEMARLPWRTRYGRALGVVAGLGVLLLVGVLVATNVFRRPAGQTTVETINAILSAP